MKNTETNSLRLLMSLFASEPLKNRRILYLNGGLFKVVSNAND